MTIVNISLYSDFDMLISVGYFQTKEDVSIKSINIDFIKSIIKKNNMIIIEENGFNLKIKNKRMNETHNIKVKDSSISSDNGFLSYICSDEYCQFLIKNGFTEVKATCVIINDDTV